MTSVPARGASHVPASPLGAGALLRYNIQEPLGALGLLARTAGHPVNRQRLPLQPSAKVPRAASIGEARHAQHLMVDFGPCLCPDSSWEYRPGGRARAAARGA